MSIFYRMDRKIDNLSPEDEKKEDLFPRVISRGNVDLKSICATVSDGTTFNAFELEAAVMAVFDRAFREMREGYNVTIKDVGTFSVTAKATRNVKQPNDLRAESIRLKKIVFRASASLLKSAGTWKFERLPKKI